MESWEAIEGGRKLVVSAQGKETVFRRVPFLSSFVRSLFVNNNP
jgi:hypothetical protein